VAILFGGLYYNLKEYRYSPIRDKQFAQEVAEDEAFLNKDEAQEEVNNNQNKDCTPPKAVIAMGHKDMWLKHHGCK
jgi:hypothetical protein